MENVAPHEGKPGVDAGQVSAALFSLVISYSRKDRRQAARLQEELARHGLRAWRDEDDIPGGTRWRQQIVGAIQDENCRVVLFLASQHANRSPQVLKELEIAESAGKTILPVCLDDTPFEGSLLHLLAGVQRLNLRKRTWSEDVERLLKALAELSLERHEPAPPPVPGGPRLALRLGLALGAVLLVVAAVVWSKLSNSELANSTGISDPETPKPGGDATPLQVKEPAGPLQVLSIDIQHYARLNPREATPKGILGKQSFNPRLGDQVTIDAKLTRPAFCYLLAFRPDGVAELCFPERDAQPPTITDRIRVPSRPDARYGLQEGTGLWVFGVVASDQPLPAFRDVVETAPPDWSPSAVQDDSGTSSSAGTGVVWRYDGEWLDPLTASGKAGVERANSEQALGNSGEVVRAIDSLKAASRADTSAAIGFHVDPAK
jgi:hypothetical protein